MRVFNLSLQRTATLSMCRALEQLHFRSHHYAQVAHLFWPYVNGELEQCEWLHQENQAFGDLPIPFMYRKLYELFPDDKYLLVTRNVDAWVESVRRHFSRMAKGQIRRPIHAYAYGYPMDREHFREDICRSTHERHYHDVQEFFEGKDNLLVLPIEQLAWEPLCDFVGRAVPATAFPRLNELQPAAPTVTEDDQ